MRLKIPLMNMRRIPLTKTQTILTKKISSSRIDNEDNSKKHRKKNSSLYCSLHGENKSHTSRECNVLKKRAIDKDNPKNGK